MCISNSFRSVGYRNGSFCASPKRTVLDGSHGVYNLKEVVVVTRVVPAIFTVSMVRTSLLLIPLIAIFCTPLPAGVSLAEDENTRTCEPGLFDLSIIPIV